MKYPEKGPTTQPQRYNQVDDFASVNFESKYTIHFYVFSYH